MFALNTRWRRNSYQRLKNDAKEDETKVRKSLMGAKASKRSEHVEMENSSH
jgi:hypothetical protein